MKNLHDIKYLLNFASVIKKQTLMTIKHTAMKKYKKYKVYTYRSKRGCEAYVKTHSIEEALELARKAGETIELTDLKRIL